MLTNLPETKSILLIESIANKIIRRKELAAWQLT